MKQEMMGWQWHQLDHMWIICISLQTNHANTLTLSILYRPDTLSDAQLTVSKHWMQLIVLYLSTYSLVFCCYHHVYDIFNVMSVGDTPGAGPWWHVYTQNGVAAYSVSRVCQDGFPLPTLQFLSSWVSVCGRSSLTAEAFLWPHCL